MHIWPMNLTNMPIKNQVYTFKLVRTTYIVTGIFFYMGLAEMPAVGCCWETDTRYPRVADMMARKRFQKLASHLHFKDNLLVTDSEKLDRAWKIRPWINYLNTNFATFSPDENNSVDEVMVAFKGRSLLKQYLSKKPKKMGLQIVGQMFCFWISACLRLRKGTGIENGDKLSDCGLGGNVVLKLCSSLPEKHNFKIFADNYFSNFQWWWS